MSLGRAAEPATTPDEPRRVLDPRREPPAGTDSCTPTPTAGANGYSPATPFAASAQPGLAAPRSAVQRRTLGGGGAARPGPNQRRNDPLDDTELLVRARGDPEAFGTFYSRYVRALLAYFCARTLDHEVASDLTAETFAAALAGVERYDPDKGSPRQWLYGIANNKLKRLWRTSRVSSEARRKLELQTPPAAATGWEAIEAADARLDSHRLARALARVPSKSREAVRLRVVEQLAYTEIAARIGCKPSSARGLVFKGLRRLRDEFDPVPADGGRT